MKLLYFGGSGVDWTTFKRMLLVGTEVVFMDRPSVTFNQWGTIGHDSYFRRFENAADAPVKISVERPNSNYYDKSYQRYAAIDLVNSAFVTTFKDGFRADDAFADRLLPLKERYGPDEGQDGASIVAKLRQAENLQPLSIDQEADPMLLYRLDSELGRQATLRTVMVEASIHLSSVLEIAEKIALLRRHQAGLLLDGLADEVRTDGHVVAEARDATLDALPHRLSLAHVRVVVAVRHVHGRHAGHHHTGLAGEQLVERGLVPLAHHVEDAAEVLEHGAVLQHPSDSQPRSSASLADAPRPPSPRRYLDVHYCRSGLPLRGAQAAVRSGGASVDPHASRNGPSKQTLCWL